MPKLIMKNGQMVIETDDDAEREALAKLAYAVTDVEIEPKAAKRAKKDKSE